MRISTFSFLSLLPPFSLLFYTAPLQTNFVLPLIMMWFTFSYFFGFTCHVLYVCGISLNTHVGIRIYNTIMLLIFNL